MSDYIEREAAVELLSQPITMSMCLSVEECHHKIAQQRIDRYLVENIPAADVRPVRRGKWVPDYDYAEYDFDGCTPLQEPRKLQDGWQCSLCGGYMSSETNFCPNCGADMREES